jgi:hypothetical protein
MKLFNSASKEVTNKTEQTIEKEPVRRLFGSSPIIEPILEQVKDSLPNVISLKGICQVYHSDDKDTI